MIRETNIMFKSHQKLLVLQELKKKDLSGYDLLKILEESLEKKPSPGYIYPLLHDLKKQQLVSSKKHGRRNVYHLTVRGDKFMQDLCKKFDGMQTEMLKNMQPVTNKKDYEQFQNYNKKVMKNMNLMLKDMDLIQPFQDAFIQVYEKNYTTKRKKLRKFLEKATKDLTSIS